MKILEASAASLEADTWCRHREEVPAARAWQERAGAAVQTAVLGGPTDAATQTEGRFASGGGEEVRPVLVTNMAASRAGTTGRFNVTHLVVPASLRPSGTTPRAFCGISWVGPSSTFSYSADVGAGEVCEK